MIGTILKTSHCKFLNGTEIDREIQMVLYISYQIIAPTLIIAGILGNIINLIILTKPVFNECTQLYLRMLAIGDLHVLVFEIPGVIRLNNLQHNTLSSAIYYAHFELVLVTLFVAFNAYIVLWLTFDRYVSVCLPELFNSVHTKKRSLIAILISFGIATAISLPHSAMKRTCYVKETSEWSFADNCNITDSIYWQTYLIISQICIRIGPAVFLGYLNVSIIRKFRALRRRRHRSPRLRAINSVSIRNLKKRYRDERRLVVLLQIVVLLFFITMIPSSILTLLYTETKEDNFNFQVFRAAANLLEIANSSLNFCAYYLCSKDFRKNMTVLFGCKPQESVVIKTDYVPSSNADPDVSGKEESERNESSTVSVSVNKF